MPKKYRYPSLKELRLATGLGTKKLASVGEKSIAASELSQAAKQEKVSKALSAGSKKAGTFESMNARKRA